MIRKLIGALTIGIVSCYTVLGVGTSASATGCATIPAVAHRGGTERYVENTRNAFRNASNVGVRFWETDVQFTADDVPVIMHDSTVDRTTNGSGAVADLTYAQIAALRTADDQNVPALADVINDQSVDKAYAFIELKTMPTDDQWATFIAALTSRAGQGGPRPAISSFDPDVLDQVAVRLPTYTRALIQSVGDSDPADITPHARILLKHHDGITPARITKWTDAGLKVYAWFDVTNDGPAEWTRMAGYPLAGVITDNPGAYVAWQKSRTC